MNRFRYSDLIDKVKIGRADIGDAESILKLQKIAYLSEARKYDDFTAPPLLQTLDDIKTEFETTVFVKATFEMTIIGSVRSVLNNGTSFIGRLIVHPDFQCQGIGTLLLSEIEKHFSHAARFEIFTGSQSANTIRLYERHGYKRFKTESLNTKVSVVYLEKPGSSSSK